MPMLSLLLCLAMATAPSDHPVQWTATAVHVEDGRVRVELTATITDGWYMYATELPGNEGPIPTSLLFQSSEAYALDGPLQEPEPKEQYDPNFAMTVRFHKGAPVFVQYVRPLSSGPFSIQGEVEFMCCTDKTCLPPRAVPFHVDVPAIDR